MGESRRVHVEKTYVNIVNVTNVTNVTNITYVNRTTAVTAMRNDDFAASRQARQHAIAVDAHQMQNVQVMARPEPRPMPRPIIAAPPARPVPVKTARTGTGGGS
jgi:ribosomal protein S11